MFSLHRCNIIIIYSLWNIFFHYLLIIYQLFHKHWYFKQLIVTNFNNSISLTLGNQYENMFIRVECSLVSVILIRECKVLERFTLSTSVKYLVYIKAVLIINFNISIYITKNVNFDLRETILHESICFFLLYLRSYSLR